MKNTRGSGGFRRLELAADRFLDVERVLAIVVGEISDRLARLVSVRNDRSRHCRHLQNWPAKLKTRIHRDNSRLGRFFCRAPSTAREGVEPRDKSFLVPLHALEVKPEQISHRQLAVFGCIDHVLEAGGFDEQVPAIREHLVMNQGMLRPELPAKVFDGITNLLQLDLILASQRVQDMGFGEVAERQSRVRRISEFNNRLGPTACPGPQRVRSSGDPRTQGVLRDLKVPGSFEDTVQRILPGPEVPSTAVLGSAAWWLPRRPS